MARGSFKRIGLRIGKPFTDVRKIFGRQAAEYAKKFLEEVVNETVENPLMREMVLSDPGLAWNYAAKFVYKTFMRLARDKADNRQLTLGADGKLNVTYDEVKAALPENAKAKVAEAVKALMATV